MNIGHSTKRVLHLDWLKSLTSKHWAGFEMFLQQINQGIFPEEGRISAVDLLVVTSLDHQLLLLKIYFSFV